MVISGESSVKWHLYRREVARLSRDASIKPGAKALMLILCDRSICSGAPYCKLGHRTLAKAAGVNIKSLPGWISSLEAEGYLSAESTKTNYGFGETKFTPFPSVGLFSIVPNIDHSGDKNGDNHVPNIDTPEGKNGHNHVPNNGVTVLNTSGKKEEGEGNTRKAYSLTPPLFREGSEKFYPRDIAKEIVLDQPSQFIPTNTADIWPSHYRKLVKGTEAHVDRLKAKWGLRERPKDSAGFPAPYSNEWESLYWEREWKKYGTEERLNEIQRRLKELSTNAKYWRPTKGKYITEALPLIEKWEARLKALKNHLENGQFKQDEQAA